MPTPATAKWPKPKNEDEFEDIVVDFVRLRWKDPNAQRHGRRGQRQHGVDVLGHPLWLKGKSAAAQSKNTDDLTLAIVIAEAAKAMTFPGGIGELYLITSGDRDAALQSDVREHFRAKPAPFHVEVIFWPDVVADLSMDDALVAKHWKGFAGPAAMPAEATTAFPFGSTWLTRDGAKADELTEHNCEFAVRSPSFRGVDATELVAELERVLSDRSKDYISSLLLRQAPTSANETLEWSCSNRSYDNVLDKWQMQIGADSLMVRRWSTFSTHERLLFSTSDLLENIVNPFSTYVRMLSRPGIRSHARTVPVRVFTRVSLFATKTPRLHDDASVLGGAARYTSPISNPTWQVSLDDELSHPSKIALRLLNRVVAQFRFEQPFDELRGEQRPAVIRLDEDAVGKYFAKAGLGER